MNAVLNMVLELVLSKLVVLAQDIIKAQVTKSRVNTKIDDEVNAVKKALSEIDSHTDKTGSDMVPPELERKLRDAARRLNSNFID